MNLGAQRPPPTEGLLTTVAWDLGEHGPKGARRRLQLRPRRLHLLFRRDDPVVERRSRADRRAAEAGPLASEIPSNEGDVLHPPLPASGVPGGMPRLGAPSSALRGTGRAHFARAAVEAMAYQCRDVVEAMTLAAGQPLTQLHADGGASAMDLLLQVQGGPVRSARGPSSHD